MVVRGLRCRIFHDQLQGDASSEGRMRLPVERLEAVDRSASCCWERDAWTRFLHADTHVATDGASLISKVDQGGVQRRADPGDRSEAAGGAGVLLETSHRRRDPQLAPTTSSVAGVNQDHH
jgi:hypothetical protein